MSALEARFLGRIGASWRSVSPVSVVPLFNPAASANLASLVISGGDDWFDPVWQLPFYKDYEDQLESEIADLNNAPTGGLAGSITAALFLMNFTNKHKNFLHFDYSFSCLLPSSNQD